MIDHIQKRGENRERKEQENNCGHGVLGRVWP